ncbi:MAG: hypothetical protein JSS79_03080 [Bacteroidetes bacterium]|nr:hypothetical protein [Bacteroidota bacterium]
MIEVFKTDVENQSRATNILQQLKKEFTTYSANFDLEDCDRILRIHSDGEINSDELIAWLKVLDVNAEVLSDNVDVFDIQELFREKIN